MLSELHHKQASLTFPTWSRSIQHIRTDNTAEIAGLPMGAREVLSTHPALQTTRHSVNLPLSPRTAVLLNQEPWMLPHASDRKPPACEAFCRELQGDVRQRQARSSRSTWGCHAHEVPIPWHKTLPQPEQSPRAPLGAIQTQDQEKMFERALQEDRNLSNC